MLNPNIEMLENLISAAVSTRYKEVPPTEEEFLTLAQSMRATLSTLPVTDEEFAEILVRLRASIVIQMDVGVYINDRNTPHKSWLPSRRADLDFFFWNRYKKYLEEIKHWNPRVTATLDKVSDEIVDLLGDPQSKEPFQRRGLVLGDVQSGKTANYTAISNKAADTGYRIIIVLAGMMENLRQQTQSRLDAEFSGRKSEYYLDPKAEQGIKNQPVGVGRYGVQKRIAAFTSVTKDFDINVLKSNDLNLQSVSDPIVLVVKKNKRILNNLIKWLSNSRDNTTGKIMLPMLLIDDEADNASVNTKSEDDSPAAINACIRQLLHEFNQASYLGITATPFANIFINPETEDEMIGDDLFPRDFIYSLAPPTNYIGADKIFGDATEKFSDVLIPLRREEMDLFFPFTHKKTLEVDALPPSMYEAIAYFLLFNAIRDLRGDYTEHRSMMIHVSRFTDVQNRIAEAVNEWLVQVKSDVQNYAALDDEKREQIASLRYLHKVWMKHQLEKISKTNWDDICSNYLNRAIAPIAVRAVNQRTGATSLDYFNHKEDGLRVIAVGGNSLSRGLTLEGLGVSYFYRKSQMYDTLLQMGRWFGYRPNYEDLFRIWMAEEAIDWYGYITRAANELKDEIAKMKLANQTPMEFGLKVRQDPNSLIATARNKMRSATQVSRPVTVSGKLLETPKLKANLEILKANEAAFKEFVDHLGSAGTRDFSVKPYYWRGVNKELVVQLLLDFETHPWHLAFQGRALAEYIDEKMDNETWDVALITDGEGSEYGPGLKCGSEVLPIKATERRSVIADDKMIRISGTKVKVGSGGCTRVGLTKEQIETARKRFKEQNGDKHIYCAHLLMQEHQELVIENLLNVFFVKQDLIQLIGKNCSISDETALSILRIASLSPDTMGYYANGNARSAPFIQISEHQYLRTIKGLLDEPFDFILYNIRNFFPEAWDKNVNQREAVFRTQLYTVFDDPRFSCVQHPVIIKEKNKTLTDIDAVVIDKKTGEIALFQLKWQDPADYSPFTLKSKRSNYYSAAEKWLEIIEKWLSNSADEDIASKLGVKVKYFDKKKISIFVLGRRRGNYSGNGPYPYECAWSQWYQIMYAASYLRQENEFTISNLYKLIVSTSPFNIKISEKPVTFCYGKYRIKFGGKTFCGKDTR